MGTAERVDEIDGISVDLGLLPAPLSECAPLIRQFAVSDDVVRSERMGAAPDSEVEAVDRVMENEEQREALAAYIDDHIEETGTPEQDLALVLSAFQEASAEALIELRERGLR
jgi:hypothetical protein